MIVISTAPTAARHQGPIEGPVWGPQPGRLPAPRNFLRREEPKILTRERRMSPNGNRRCKAQRIGGEPCRSTILGLSGYCSAHDPNGGLEEIRRRAHRGGQITKAAFQSCLHNLPPLRGPEDAKVWLEQLARATVTNRLSGSAANAARGAVLDWMKAYEASELADRLKRLEEHLVQQQAGERRVRV